MTSWSHPSLSKLTPKQVFTVGALFIPLVLFLLVSIYYISQYHVWPLSRDQWHMYAPYFERGLWQTLLSPMSDHRHIFPFLFFHVDMAFFHGNNHFLVACGALFDVLLIALLLKALYQKTGNQSLQLSHLEQASLTIFIIAQLTWLLNIAQLGWGFMSTQYYLTLLSLFLSIYGIYYYKLSGYQCSRWLVLSVACGFVATFSFGMGILVWPCLLYFLFIGKAPWTRIILVIFSLFMCLILFFILPGGNEIEHALLFSPINTFKFTLQLPAGPLYFLLKSWRFIDNETIKSIASIIGVTASLSGIAMLIYIFIKRPRLSLFETFCCTLMLVGIGTAVLISFARPAPFLDIWVDRYQIWATLFWTGFIPLIYLALCVPIKNTVNNKTKKMVKKILLGGMLSLPILAFPSQLDLGSRLYEYKTRVQKSLLYYQLNIPDKQAAIDALHWNWEHKLPFFLYTLNELKTRHKNIYYQNPVGFLDRPLRDLQDEYFVRDLSLSSQQIKKINAQGLLGNPEATSNKSAELNKMAYTLYAKTPNSTDWVYAVHVNQKNIINGIGLRIKHSALPRPIKNYTQPKYHLFSIVKDDPEKAGRWYGVNVIE